MYNTNQIPNFPSLFDTKCCLYNNKIPRTETGVGVDGEAAEEEFLHAEDHGDSGEHPQTEAGDSEDPGRQPEDAEDHQPDQWQDRSHLRRRR